ncbi:MAG: hypothetical protein NVSMB56_06900 [Pyrinomonadaceae bacterium]
MSNPITQEAFNHLVNDLRATHGANLASVVVYGSAVAGDHKELRGGYNLLIALKRITPEDLRVAQAPMREWQRLGHPLPVYMTLEELHNGSDVFPIEYSHMGRSRVVLHGDDPFATMQLTNTNLRHQTEYELRAKLIQLRRRYISASGSAEKLTDLMCGSLVDFARLFEAVLVLHGVGQPPVKKRECVRAVCDRLGLDNKAFERLFEIRAQGQKLSNEQEANEIFTAYIAQIEKVIEAVDGMNTSDNA